MKLAKILDDLKKRNGVTSNAEIGRILGIDKRRIGDYYGTDRTPTDEDYARISLASGIREDEIRAAVKLERAKDDSERKLWAEYLKKFGGMAASLALAVCANVIFEMTPMAGNALAASNPTSQQFVLCKLIQNIRVATAAASNRLCIWFRRVYSLGRTSGGILA